MIRILIRTAIYVGSAALGLWIASILLDGFEIHAPGFLVATLIFAGTQFLLSPHVTKLSEQHAVALTGGVGLISTLVALVAASLLSSGLSIRGIGTWILATLVVWLVTSLGAWLLPLWLLKEDPAGRPLAQ